MRIEIDTPLRSTEDRERVRMAIATLFPDAKFETSKERVEAISLDPTTLRRRIWELRIIDTIRDAIRVDGDTARVSLQKQAAVTGRVSLPPRRHALGELDVLFRVDETDPWPDAEAFLWWLCPETREGQIVDPES